MSDQPLWTPSAERIAASNMTRFMELVNARHGAHIRDYAELHRWSTASVENIAAFWELVAEFVDLRFTKKPDRVLDDGDRMPGAKFFPGATLNFAENLLRFNDDRDALVFQPEAGPVTRVTYAELRKLVARAARGLRAAGVQKGDRVAGFMPNMPETVVAMLAATGMGAVWSSCSPDFGIQGVIDRFGQIKPRVLFTPDGYFFKGKSISSLERAAEIAKLIPAIERVVVVPYAGDGGTGAIRDAVQWGDFLGPDDDPALEFTALPFDHPVYVMYSSGTTGLPKCMVQGPGVLLNHLKEHVIHTDLKRNETTFYFTTCGWMMWNWLVSALAVGATLVLYDGNPFHPDAGALFRMADELKINVFGTSARWLRAVEESGLRPKDEFKLDSVRAILSTGSPLSAEQFEWVYAAVKRNVQLASISGGTDLNGCFALGVPTRAVYKGELQGLGLGMKVEIRDESGRPVIGERGELCCAAPFPSMPLYFWDDGDGEKYRKAYFDKYPNVWRHGDFAEVNERGGLIVHGRSDATLNPGGVRIGTADIYSRLELMPEIEDSVIIGQNWKNDVRIVLFVKPAPGVELDDALRKKIVADIRGNVSPRHVPAKILTTPDVPYTLNMKKVELAVKRTVDGEAVLNKDALRNPESLEHFKNRPELMED